MSDLGAPSAAASERDTRGRFGRGNTASLVHGGRRRALSVQDARQSDFYQRWVQQAGSEDRLALGERELLVRAVELDQTAETAARYLRGTRERITNPRVQMVIKTHQASVAALSRLLEQLERMKTSRPKQDADTLEGYIASFNEQKEQTDDAR